MRILELGTNFAPAYAGMILAEQGHRVVKPFVDDPILRQRDGYALWCWVNEGKELIPNRRAGECLDLLANSDAVIDNFRASTWERWGLDPGELARKHNLRWVSMRADDDGQSFDVLAQARAWGDITEPIPFYLGDTAFGLWAAFKLFNTQPGLHSVVRHATCLAKLVEGEGVVNRHGQRYPWKRPGTYGFDGEAFTIYKGQRLAEPLRDDQWRRRHLPNRGGRYTV